MSELYHRGNTGNKILIAATSRETPTRSNRAESPARLIHRRPRCSNADGEYLKLLALEQQRCILQIEVLELKKRKLQKELDN